MSFKIVETIEKGEYKLTTVPQSWEIDGTLRWPKLNRENLRRDPFSTPEGNWRSINCIVKRKNFKTFEEAENELKAMSDVSDTDQETLENLSSKSKPQPKKTNFNDMARKSVQFAVTQAQLHSPSPASKVRLEPKKYLQTAADSNDTSLLNAQPTRIESEISEFVVLQPMNSNSKPETVQPTQVQAYECRENVPEIEFHNSYILTQEGISREFANNQLSVTNTDILTASVKDLSNKLASIETKIDEFIANTSKNQIIITLNQEAIMQTLAQISTQFDEFIKHTSTPNIQRNDLNEGMKIISNEGSLMEFEQLLKNNQFLEEMKKVYSVVCGKGKGRAINNAYALIDAMFDRNFLKQCSWAGGSRGEASKICFKSYTRTINLFFDVIYESDKQFTKLECDSFFKNILRNAKKRSESKLLKRSTQKKRQKKKVSENKQNESPALANEEENGSVVSGNEEPEETEPANEGSEDEIVNESNLLSKETEV